MSEAEAREAMRLAIGRILRIASRPEQPGDLEEYAKAREVAMEAAEVLGVRPASTAGAHRPGWNFGNLVVE